MRSFFLDSRHIDWENKYGEQNFINSAVSENDDSLSMSNGLTDVLIDYLIKKNSAGNSVVPTMIQRLCYNVIIRKPNGTADLYVRIMKRETLRRNLLWVSLV